MAQKDRIKALPLVTPDFDKLAYDVIGICMHVHSEVGPGFPESYYQRALEIEFSRQDICFKAQKHVQLTYCDQPIGTNYIDFDINNQIILEIKSIAALTQVHMAQVLKYIAAMKRPAGLLVNFGQASLEHKRIYATNKIKESWQKSV